MWRVVRDPVGGAERPAWVEKAFRLDRFDAVVKVGGSVIWSDLAADVAAALVGPLRLLVIPGGGAIDSQLEARHERRPMSAGLLHAATLLAQDQSGLIFAAERPGLVTVRSIAEAEAATSRGEVPILLPSALFSAIDVFRYTSRVTSDTMAAWLASTLQIPQLIIIKSRLPASGSPELRVQDLASDASFVDESLPHLLAQTKLPCCFASSSQPGLRELVAKGVNGELQRLVYD